MSRYEARRDADTRAALDDYEKVKADRDALLAALDDAAMRACQDRIASGIGRRKATDTVRFLQGALERIQKAAESAITKAKGGAA